MDCRAWTDFLYFRPFRHVDKILTQKCTFFTAMLIVSNPDVYTKIVYVRKNCHVMLVIVMSFQNCKASCVVEIFLSKKLE